MKKARKSMSAQVRGLTNQNDYLKRQMEAARGHNREMEKALDSLQWLMDAILCATAKKYGDCENENGVILGWRMTLPMKDVQEGLKSCFVRAKKNENNEYVIAVVRKEVEENGMDSEGHHAAAAERGAADCAEDASAELPCE